MAKKIKLPSDDVYDRILKYWVEDNYILSEQDEKVLKRINAAFGIMQQTFCSREVVRKKIVRIFGVSDRTARKDVEASINMYYNPKKLDKNMKRAMLEEYQMRILEQCMSQKPPNLEAANRAIANLIKITGVEKDDVLDLSNIDLPIHMVLTTDESIKQELPTDWRLLLEEVRSNKEKKLTDSRSTIEIEHEEVE